MKITDMKCAVIGDNPVVRIITDEGIDGYGQAESSKPYLKPHVLYYRDKILDKDPTDVERVMSAIRRYGSSASGSVRPRPSASCPARSSRPGSLRGRCRGSAAPTRPARRLSRSHRLG